MTINEKIRILKTIVEVGSCSWIFDCRNCPMWDQKCYQPNQVENCNKYLNELLMPFIVEE